MLLRLFLLLNYLKVAAVSSFLNIYSLSFDVNNTLKPFFLSYHYVHSFLIASADFSAYVHLLISIFQVLLILLVILGIILNASCQFN